MLFALEKHISLTDFSQYPTPVKYILSMYLKQVFKILSESR